MARQVPDPGTAGVIARPPLLFLSALLLGLASDYVLQQPFAIPGSATALIEAVQSRDVPTVQALTLLLAVVALAFSVTADLVCQRLAPRSEALR